MFEPLKIRQCRGNVLLLGLLSVAITLPASALAQAPPAKAVALVEMSEPDRTKMAQEIVAIANRVANEIKYFEEEVRPITMTGAFDVENNVFHFDMEDRFGPEAGYDELADMHRSIERAIEPLAARIDKPFAIYWTYGGKDIEYWMPRPVAF